MDAANDYVEVWHATDGWRWHRKAANHEIVSESGEAFTAHAYALESATTLNPDCPIVNVDIHEGTR